MLIDFIGCPRSGKTTTAARVFANLKEAGFPCEYVPEQARLHIALLRIKNNLKPEESLTLTDIDQDDIMYKQNGLLYTMTKACGDSSIIITDTSPLNSLLYMTEEFRATETPQAQIKTYLKLFPNRLTFFAKPVPWVGGLDPNRVHSEEQSKAINDSIPNVIFPLLTEEPTVLIGDTDMRWRQATSEVLKRIMNVDTK